MDWACEVETSQLIWCVRRLQYEMQQFNGVTCGQKRSNAAFFYDLALYFGFLLKQCPLKKKLELTRELTLKSSSFQLRIFLDCWLSSLIDVALELLLSSLILSGVDMESISPSEFCSSVTATLSHCSKHRLFSLPRLVVSLLACIKVIQVACDSIKENG